MGNGNYISLLSSNNTCGSVVLFSSSKGGETAGSVAFFSPSSNSGIAYQGGETAGSVAYSSGSSCGTSCGSFSAIA